MTSWLTNYCRWGLTNILQCGPIPTHVAFIMDGNRRWAKKRHLETKLGHDSGFERLRESLEWCLELGIQMVTVYAFSIENFKRSREEVDYLMLMVIEKVSLLLKQEELIEKHGISVRVIGNWSFLSKDVQKALAKIVFNSRNNNKAILNVCFSYTSRDEICQALKDLGHGIEHEIIHFCDVTEELFEKCLYQQNDVDLLIRTSGEHRLSDFLLWQSSYSCLFFLSVLWPDFSWWHLYWTIIQYQKNYDRLVARRETHLYDRDKSHSELDEQFLSSIEQHHQKKMAFQIYYCVIVLVLPLLLNKSKFVKNVNSYHSKTNNGSVNPNLWKSEISQNCNI